jgi:hypothetical protein
MGNIAPIIKNEDHFTRLFLIKMSLSLSLSLYLSSNAQFFFQGDDQ